MQVSERLAYYCPMTESSKTFRSFRSPRYRCVSGSIFTEMLPVCPSQNVNWTRPVCDYQKRSENSELDLLVHFDRSSSMGRCLYQPADLDRPTWDFVPRQR